MQKSIFNKKTPFYFHYKKLNLNFCLKKPLHFWLVSVSMIGLWIEVVLANNAAETVVNGVMTRSILSPN